MPQPPASHLIGQEDAVAPRVILLDLQLPDLDGLSVCEILRAQPSTRDVPVVIFSVLDRPLSGPGYKSCDVS
jgi:CheY-like chemotaxis protein